MNPISFVSLGPGDPDLITLKAWRTLCEATDIFCPETLAADGKVRSRAAEIIERLKVRPAQGEAGGQAEGGGPGAAVSASPGPGPSPLARATVHRFPLPMARNHKRAARAYEAVCQYASTLARQGRRVCMACEGDAGFYSSIHYIYDRLRDTGVPVEMIPGVPAFLAAGTLAGLHVADGDGRLTVIPGTATADEVASLATGGHTVVVMKPSRCAGELRRCVEEHPELSYHYFEQVGMPGQVYTQEREQIVSAPFPYCSLLIVQAEQS